MDIVDFVGLSVRTWSSVDLFVIDLFMLDWSGACCLLSAVSNP
jgi:hypothetical protein